MRERLERITLRAALPAAAVLLALVVGGLLVAALGASPWEAAGIVMVAGFGCDAGYCNLGGTLALAGPIIFCALGAVVSLRSGLFSIGQEGQYALGGLAGAVIGYAIPAPAGIHPILCLIAAAAVGALWGVIPAILKVFLGVNELIITIVLNAMAGLLVDYLVNHPLRAEASTVGYTHTIADTAKLPVFDPSTKVGVAFVLAAVASVLVWLYLSHTTRGYEQRMSGEATLFARYAGMSAASSVLRAGIIGGALAGLGGGIQVIGVNYRVIEGFSDGTGFTGLTAAILGGVTALGAGFVGILYAGITVGAVNGLQIMMGVPREIGSTLLALMIVLVAIQAPFQSRIERARERARTNRRLDAAGEQATNKSGGPA